MHFTSLSLLRLKCHFHNQNTSFFNLPQTNACQFTAKTCIPASAKHSKFFHHHLADDILRYPFKVLENIITIIYHKNTEVKPKKANHTFSTEKAMKSTWCTRYPQIVGNLWISRRKHVENLFVKSYRDRKYHCG